MGAWGVQAFKLGSPTLSFRRVGAYDLVKRPDGARNG